jgi:hypothetical protein
MSFGECVEKSNLNNNIVYKKFLLFTDQKKHNIDISEYRIEDQKLNPDHSSKLLLSFRYQFFMENGKEKLKVMQVYKPLKSFFAIFSIIYIYNLNLGLTSLFKNMIIKIYFQVFKLLPGESLKVSGWFWKTDSTNRRYNDV